MSCDSCVKPNKVTQNNTVNTIRATGIISACAGGSYRVNFVLDYRDYETVDDHHPTPTQDVVLAAYSLSQRYVSTRLELYNCKQ